MQIIRVIITVIVIGVVGYSWYDYYETSQHNQMAAENNRVVDSLSEVVEVRNKLVDMIINYFEDDGVEQETKRMLIGYAEGMVADKVNQTRERLESLAEDNDNEEFTALVSAGNALLDVYAETSEGYDGLLKAIGDNPVDQGALIDQINSTLEELLAKEDAAADAFEMARSSFAEER